MSQNKDFRKQSAVPTTPTEATKVVLYANASGQLNIVNSDGTVSSVGGQFSRNISLAGGTITTGSLVNGTGFYGVTTGATAPYPSLLGAPSAWLVAVGPSGEKFVIPGYTYV